MDSVFSQRALDKFEAGQQLNSHKPLSNGLKDRIFFNVSFLRFSMKKEPNLYEYLISGFEGASYSKMKLRGNSILFLHAPLNENAP